jgi:undecaprenyl pyrophosphate phosphatase UppP
LAAAEFSFLLGVIAMAGAGVLLLPELTAVSGAELINTAFGCAAALVSGLIALKLFIWLLREQRFHLFAWYAWALGGATLIALSIR